MKTISITLYYFNELNDNAKKVAIQNFKKANDIYDIKRFEFVKGTEWLFDEYNEKLMNIGFKSPKIEYVNFNKKFDVWFTCDDIDLNKLVNIEQFKKEFCFINRLNDVIINHFLQCGYKAKVFHLGGNAYCFADTTNSVLAKKYFRLYYTFAECLESYIMKRYEEQVDKLTKELVSLYEYILSDDFALAYLSDEAIDDLYYENGTPCHIEQAYM